MAFAHLHVHTEYSLLDGSNKIKDCIARVKELGMTSVAITDHGVMYGVIDFYKEALKQGIHPVLGCEVYVAPRSRFDKERIEGEKNYNHLILLAENETGYNNLVKIVSRGFTEGYYYKPRVDKELLRQHHEGLIALSACLAGEVQRFIASGDLESAKKSAMEHREIFGDGNYFLELQDHGIPVQQQVNATLLAMSKELGIPLVATNDVHYTYETDADAHDLLLCMQTGKKVQDEDRLRYEHGKFYLKSEAEMQALFPYAKEALENTQKIADRCQVEIRFHERKLPQYDVPAPYTAESYLEKLCLEGFVGHYPEDDGTLRARLDYELSVIKEMGFVDYFLIVWDFINYAKEHGIMVGPGRGSAAGSIVSYCLHITEIDPIRYSLLFERFLNPERVSMPDIDVDFCEERRGEVIAYVSDKYGADKVVQIVTFGTLAAKAVIRDVVRVLDLPIPFATSLVKMIPPELKITIKSALEKNPELKGRYDTEPDVRMVLDYCMRLEGLPKNSGTHAAGVVICQKPAEELIPLSLGKEGPNTQFNMTTVEELGLLKMDFLGLRTLTVIRDACRLVKKIHGVDIDIQQLDINDKKVYDMIGTGKNDGVFQLESAGMKSFMKELKPQCLEDVIAGIALYRPGPMDFIPAYIAGKNDPDHIVYDCPQMEPILKATYGVIVYQEQVMQIVRDLAGYTLGRSDLVRRAMSKKKQDVMEKERANFVYGNPEEGVPGCVASGISEAVANRIFDKMMDFAQYAFNKSHAAAYAVVTYQTAYLKCYYPAEFMAATMTSFKDNLEKVASYLRICKSEGIDVLPPDINHGFVDFSTQDGKIVYALAAIKGVGEKLIATIVEERENRGPYQSLQDFIERLCDTELNVRAVESFIKAGALDCLPGNRNQKLSIYDKIVDQYKKDKKNHIPGQMSLFDMVDGGSKEEYEIPLPKVEELDPDTKLSFEKEVVGIYVSGHPLDAYEALWKEKVSATAVDFVVEEDETDGYAEGLSGGADASVADAAADMAAGTSADTDTDVVGVKAAGMRLYDKQRVVVGGVITKADHRFTKTGQRMAMLTLEDFTGTMDIIVFSRGYEKCGSLLEEDARLFLVGNVNEEDQAMKLFADNAVTFADVAAGAPIDTGRPGKSGWGQQRGGSGSARGQQRQMDIRKKPTDGTKEVWLKFASAREYEGRLADVQRITDGHLGNDKLVIFIADKKQIKAYGQGVDYASIKGELEALLGVENVKER